MTFGPPGHPLEVQGRFCIDFGCDYGVLEAPLLDEDRTVCHDFTIDAFGAVPGWIFLGFMISQSDLEDDKPYKFIVLLFKIKVLLNIMKARSGRSPESIFHGFGTALGSMGQFLDDLGTSCLRLVFERVLRRWADRPMV